MIERKVTHTTRKDACHRFPIEGQYLLVGNALNHTNNSYKHLANGDITLHLMLSKLAASLICYQNIDLDYILELLESKFKREHRSYTSMTSGGNQ